MILNNTQANIFKVNGGIADNFANRPAANGSFYIFYSIDTQEIYYDNGAWVLLGSGGGGGVNIYNTDGTLTGNRTLSGANNDLTFADLNIFKTSAGGNDVGILLDFFQGAYNFGDGNVFSYLQINTGNTETYLINGYVDIGRTNVFLNVWDSQNLIKSQYQGNDIGLKLDFVNGNFKFGDLLYNNIDIDINNGTQIISQNGILIDNFNGIYTTSLAIANNLVKSLYQGNDIGLKLDFVNTIYQFGQITGGASNNQLIINDANYWFYTSLNGQNRGLFFQVSPGARTYNFGELTANNRTQITIDDILETTTFFHAGVQKGLKLDYAQRRYQFGQLSANNLTSFNIEDNGGFIYCLYQNNGVGFSFQSNVSNYQYGQCSGGNLSKLVINDLTNQIYLSNANVFNGWFCDFNTKIYRFGQINGGNLTRYVIDDNNTYPLGVEGNNITSGTSGGSSGQHLKIKVNGVDYKIRLENP